MERKKNQQNPTEVSGVLFYLLGYWDGGMSHCNNANVLPESLRLLVSLCKNHIKVFGKFIFPVSSPCLPLCFSLLPLPRLSLSLPLFQTHTYTHSHHHITVHFPLVWSGAVMSWERVVVGSPLASTPSPSTAHLLSGRFISAYSPVLCHRQQPF